MKISFSGQMGSGKDYTAAAVSRIIKEMYGTSIYYLSFGEPLKKESQEFLDDFYHYPEINSKDMMKEKHNLSEMHFNNLVDICKYIPKGSKVYNKTPEIRTLMQYWGTELRRSEHPDYWVEKCRENIRVIEEENKNTKVVIIVTDARFLNEINMLSIEGFFTIRLDTEEDIIAERILKRDGIVLDKNALSHKSENAFKEYDNYDLIIKNNNINIDKIAKAIIELSF